jgi:hypothetical protein
MRNSAAAESVPVNAKAAQIRKLTANLALRTTMC